MEVLHLQDIIQDMEDNFNLKKYLAKGKLYEAIPQTMLYFYNVLLLIKIYKM